MTFVDRMDSPAPKTFRMFLREPCGFVLEALGKPSSNVPFIMPKRVAETPADKQIDRGRSAAGPTSSRRTNSSPATRRSTEEHEVCAAQGAAVGTAGGKHVYVERVEWNLALRDAQSQVNALAGGEVDVLERPAFESYEQLRESARQWSSSPRIRSASSTCAASTTCIRRSTMPKVRRRRSPRCPQEPFLRAQVGVKDLYGRAPRCSPAVRPMGQRQGQRDPVQVQHEEGAGARERPRATTARRW